jgi:CTP synthase
LREIGLQPHVLLCRTEKPLGLEVRQKLALFCNVPLPAVVEVRDVDHTIYELPLTLQDERLDETVCRLLRLETPSAQMTEWRRFVQRVISPRKNLKVAVVGKYIDLQDAYKSIYESLTHAGAANDCGIEIVKIDSEDLEGAEPGKALGTVAGIIVPGGFGDRGVEGKIVACKYAREKRLPYLGLCLWIQGSQQHRVRRTLSAPCHLSFGGPERSPDERGLHAFG